MNFLLANDAALCQFLNESRWARAESLVHQSPFLAESLLTPVTRPSHIPVVPELLGQV